MKKALFVMLAVLALILPVSSAFAAGKDTVDGMKFTLPSGYTLYTDDDLGTVSGADGVRFVALSGDRNSQIQMRCTDDDFAKSIGSFYGLDAETVDPAGKKLFEDGYTCVTVNSMAYVKKAYDYDSDRVVIYVTVYDGKLYTLTYFGDDPSEMGEFIGTVSFPSAEKPSPLKAVIITVTVFFIIVDILFAVWLVSSLLKDYRRYKMAKNENVVSQYIKIKRRKY